MRTLKPFLGLGLVLTFVLASCSVEKRVYQPGYHIEWKASKGKTKPMPVEHAEKRDAVKTETAEVIVPQIQVAEVEAPVLIEAAEVNTMAARTEEKVIVEPKASSAKATEKAAEPTSIANTFPSVITPDGFVHSGKKASLKDAMKIAKKSMTKPSGNASRWLWLWIGALVLATVLWVVGIALISPALVLVGYLVYIAFVVFFILWLVALFS